MRLERGLGVIRALARQAGGHWFEPSTAHSLKAPGTGLFRWSAGPPGFLRRTKNAHTACGACRDHPANGALAAAERLIQLDSLNERGWSVAMEADGALGNRQAILDRYERLTRELDDRLGLRPNAEVEETYRRLLGQT